jgi:mannose-6-phosphate isomerase-like protein (cupin superfamily)
MAKSGDVIYNAISTDRITFLQTRDETGNALLRFNNEHSKAGIGPAPHRHPLQEESFIISSGLLNITIDGKSTTFGKGERVVVPAGALHYWKAVGDQDLRMITEFRPALHFEEIIETIACLSQKGKMDKKGNPDPLQMSATLSAYYGEFWLGTMPMSLQRLLFGPFGRLLRMLGFKKHLKFADLPTSSSGMFST